MHHFLALRPTPVYAAGQNPRPHVQVPPEHYVVKHAQVLEKLNVLKRSGNTELSPTVISTPTGKILFLLSNFSKPIPV
jgi:hypothetical protein